LDKNQAYGTLYHVLVKLIKLLAPFTPFFTEVMYQNLVVAVKPQAYDSIHHTGWPEVDPDALDEPLIAQMALARRVASLGLSARSAAGIKLRQPLAKVIVHPGEDREALDKDLVAILQDELNVKTLEFIADADQLVNFRVLPDNKILGPKYGARFPLVRAALNSLPVDDVVRLVTAGEAVNLQLEGEQVALEPGEIIVLSEASEGLAVAADKGVTVGVETLISDDLRAEGLAREVVRRIQSMRKSADFNIEDRIETCFQADGELAEVMGTWAEFIQGETLSIKLENQPPGAGMFSEAFKIGDSQLQIGIKQISLSPPA
jgi:isoleucyl-tRNA synthetase